MISLRYFLLALTGPRAVFSANSIEVDTNSLLQHIHGFGFSQAFGRASEFQAASTDLQQKALDLLFDTETGAGFSIIRNNIPSTSASTIEPDDPGSPSAAPNYTWNGDDAGQVWFTKQAVSYGVSTIYANAWSAPGFMKTSGDEATPGYLCGTNGHHCTSGDWRQAYANYLVQYVKFYESEGILITHLGFLNEPDWETGYSQMQISPNATEATSFIPILYKTIQNANLDLNVTCCDAVGWSDQKTYTTALMAAGMDSYLDVITSHMYTSDATSNQNTSLPAWVSESGVETSGAPFTTTWYDSGAPNEGMIWASKLATGFIDAGLSAYLFWEGFEINQTQSASHLVDLGSDSEAEGSAILYAFAMWSRFIRPGARRVFTIGSLTDVATAAFVNPDDSVIVVLTNSGDAAQTAQIGFSAKPKAAKAWVTDNDHRVAPTNATLSGAQVKVVAPAHGVVTIKVT
ncbi:CAZyme family GH30 [Aspergillus niger]|nr:CAZyme family GH30 [Aspergillus niger]